MADYVPDMMDQRITIQRATTAKDANGVDVETWATWKERDAAMTYGGGSESPGSSKETAYMTVSFQVRWVDGITEKDRIMHKTYIYDIVSITPNGRNHFQTIETQFRR